MPSQEQPEITMSHHTHFTHLPWLFLWPLTFGFSLFLGSAEACVALFDSLGAFLAWPCLTSMSLASLPFLGTFLAAPGLGGTFPTAPSFLCACPAWPGLDSLGFLETGSLAFPAFPAFPFLAFLALLGCVFLCSDTNCRKVGVGERAGVV